MASNQRATGEGMVRETRAQDSGRIGFDACRPELFRKSVAD
jgi:hypothetical protein